MFLYLFCMCCLVLGVFLLRANSFVVSCAAFAGVKCALALSEYGLRLCGNVKTCHSGYPKAAFAEFILKRGDRGCYTAELKNKHGETVQLLAAGDKDKKPMFLISTSGTTLMGEMQTRRRKTIYANGDYEIHNFELAQYHVHAHYRGRFNKIDKHNQARQGTHCCIEDSNRTHTWWVRDFMAIFATGVVNAQYAWNLWGPPSTTPDAKPVSTVVFTKMLAKALLFNPTRKGEVAYAASSLALRAKQPRWNMAEQVHASRSDKSLCHYDSLDRALYSQGYCKYCNDKTSSICLTCTPADALPKLVKVKSVGRNGKRRPRGAANKVFFVCTSGSRHQCVLRHTRGDLPSVTIHTT
jgi:hypothetical protein